MIKNNVGHDGCVPVSFLRTWLGEGCRCNLCVASRKRIGCEKETENPCKGKASPFPSQEPSLQFITHCGNSWLVGVNGKSVDKMAFSGGSLGGIPYVAVGNEELGKASAVGEFSPCKKCGELVNIEEAKMVSNKQGGGFR